MRKKVSSHYDIPEGHDPSDIEAAQDVVNADGIPLGVIYRDTNRPTFDQKVQDTTGNKNMKSIDEMFDALAI